MDIVNFCCIHVLTLFHIFICRSYWRFPRLHKIPWSYVLGQILGTISHTSIRHFLYVRLLQAESTGYFEPVLQDQKLWLTD